MSDLWQTIREAIADKIDTSAGVRAAGLRKANTKTDETLSPPEVKVLEPAMQLLDQGNAYLEQYDMEFTAELLVPRPAGRQRSSPSWAAIARAIQVEWRTGITLGLSPEVWHSQLTSVSPGLSEYAETDLDGCVLTFQVRVYETFAPGRTP